MTCPNGSPRNCIPLRVYSEGAAQQLGYAALTCDGRGGWPAPGDCRRLATVDVTLLQPSFPFAPGMPALTCEIDHGVEGIDADRGRIAEQGCVGGDHHPGDLGRRAAH